MDEIHDNYIGYLLNGAKAFLKFWHLSRLKFQVLVDFKLSPLLEFLFIPHNFEPVTLKTKDGNAAGIPRQGPALHQGKIPTPNRDGAEDC